MQHDDKPEESGGLYEALIGESETGCAKALGLRDFREWLF